MNKNKILSELIITNLVKNALVDYPRRFINL